MQPSLCLYLNQKLLQWRDYMISAWEKLQSLQNCMQSNKSCTFDSSSFEYFCILENLPFSFNNIGMKSNNLSKVPCRNFPMQYLPSFNFHHQIWFVLIQCQQITKFCFHNGHNTYAWAHTVYFRSKLGGNLLRQYEEHQSYLSAYLKMFKSIC